jgi:hypothetical protein
MATAGSAHFRVGERLYLVDVDQVSEVLVVKTTGQAPYPELVRVERPGGQRLIMHPLSLSRDRAVMEAIFAAFVQLGDAARDSGYGSEPWLAARRNLIGVQLAAVAEHPYRLRVGEHPDRRFAVRPPMLPLS